MPARTLICALASTAMLTGCIERKETITVHRDGAVDLAIRFKGDPADIDAGDAMPLESLGWRLDREIESGDDDEKLILRGRLRIDADAEIPDSFAEPGTPEYEVALRFPTALEIERRADGVYYHFQRTYEMREAARFDYHRERVQVEHGLEDLSEMEFEEMSAEHRENLVSGLAGIEAFQQAEYVDDAVEAVGDEWPQDYGLRLRSAVLDHFRNADIAPLLELISEEPGPDRDRSIAEFGQEHIDGAREELVHELRALRISRTDAQAFLEIYDLATARRDVTNDLHDEQFRVSVTLPGTIVAHNADGSDGATVHWEFDANALMDREQSLRVTSRVGGREPRSRD